MKHGNAHWDWLNAAELLEGVQPQDSLIGTPGNDSLVGTAGNDTLDGAAGADTMVGLAGNDTYHVDNAGDIVDEAGGSGIDLVRATVNYTLGAGVENLHLTGTSVTGRGNELDNTMTGDSAWTYLYGGDGNDSIVGAEWAVGGGGNDTLVGAAGRENGLFGQDGNDLMIGSAEADTLAGDSGNDVLFCNGGDDEATINALFDPGLDTADGGQGHDRLSLYVFDDKVLNWTNDAFTTQVVAGHTVSGFEELFVVCGDGDDFVSNAMFNAADMFNGGGGNDRFLAGSGDDLLGGGEGNDTLSGGGSDDSLAGDVGHDILNAGSGNDGLFGGEGDDRLQGGPGNDGLNGGSGRDTLSGSRGIDQFIFMTADSDRVVDFRSGTDQVNLPRHHLPVGDRDSGVDQGVTIPGPGGFGAQNELVIVTGNIAGAITADSAAAAIGSSADAYKAGRTAVFVVDNGTDSAVYYFTSSALDATVSAAELSLIATLEGTASTSTNDYSFKP